MSCSTATVRSLPAGRPSLTPAEDIAGSDRPPRPLGEAHQADALIGCLDWILQAYAVTGNRGISAGYDLIRRSWKPAYPETTGYTIPTLFDCSRRLDRPDVHRTAVALADYLLAVRTPEGGVGHWSEPRGGRPAPIIFDTGQALVGWLSAWCETRVQPYLQAAVDAADWLCTVQGADGAWRTHQYLGSVKAIDSRVAWALAQVGLTTGERKYLDAAQRNLDWVLTQQQGNGWFRHAEFEEGEDPSTHTIAYTVEGILESALALNDSRGVSAAVRAGAILLAKRRHDGSLPGTFGTTWEPTARWSCLTGNCQMALVWMRLHQLTGEMTYLNAARLAIEFVTSRQNLKTRDVNVRGGIPGSAPIFGRYERLKYPNWAAKFFIDALLALETVGDRDGR
jgi:hypothetical protein